jgi:hypothetical protein
MAQKMDVYDGIYIYDEHSLDKAFYEHFKDKFKLRGFGYWCYKPQIILQTFEKMNEGDILQYTDIGCHLNESGIGRLNEYFEIAGKENIVVFEMNHYTEKQWTKADILDYFGVRCVESIYQSQIMGGVFFLKKCPKSLDFVKKWRQVFYDDFSLIDDSPSKSRNFPEFIENRHDQSVFSILAKLNNAYRLSSWEVETRQRYFPILATRDKIFLESFVIPATDKKIVCWGAGLSAIYISDYFLQKHVSIYAFMDSDPKKIGMSFFGKKFFQRNMLSIMRRNILSR